MSVGTRFAVSQRWSVAVPTFAAEELARALRIPPLLARCLVNRGLITSDAAQGFLEPRLKQLADPFLLPDMAEAIEALLAAHRAQETVLIFGDYDVDGVTSTTILLETLLDYGFQVKSFLPHRLEDGYGLSLEAAERAVKDSGARLLLAVDCGSTSFESITALGARGVTVIVLDHHQVSSPPPPARALVNPQRGTAFRELCSAGLAFKLAHALTKKLRELKWPAADQLDLRNFLDLVALGTVADIVPLQGENRILVTAGLKRLAETNRPGLIALKAVAGVQECGQHEIAFQLAPRLNAAGRLEHAEAALNLLRAQNSAEATELAAGLDLQNRERQQVEKQIVEECLGAVRVRFDPSRDFALVEACERWHIGVVGIVASRLQKEFHRPVIVIGSDGASWRGSGRSIEGFDIAAGLRECGHLLEKHGGHAMAAGLSLRPDNLQVFRERFNEVARASLDPLSLQRNLRLDAEVQAVDITLETVQALERLEPHGCGNPCAQILVRGVRPQGEPRRLGAEQKHLRFALSRNVDVVWWNAGELPAAPFDIAAVPQLNTYNGTTRVQLKLLDVRPAT